MRALLFTAALVAAAPAVGQAIPIQLVPGEALLQVSGEGQARSRPDVMTITAGVVTTGRSAREALTANAVLADRLVSAVRANGVDAADVRTAALTVDPRFAEDEGVREVPRITGYVARNQLELRLRDLEASSRIIDSLFEAGANEVQGPHFSLADPMPAEATARLSAVAAAREEASAHADALGMRITRVLRVSQRGEFRTDGDDHIVVTGSRIPRTPVEPGEIETSVEVWIDYAMAPK